jgi:hypothetical protein
MADQDLMPAGGFRKLTSGELALCAEVFGEALDARRIVLFAIPLWSRAFVTGPRLVVWPARTAAKDFSAASLADQAVFVHELTHVWQAQNGVNLILGKLRAGDSVQSYAYELSDNADFRAMNIEQQAMVVQDAFVAARGGPAPFETQAYSAILATWPGRAGLSPRNV